MRNVELQTLRGVELQRFSDNATRLLLDRGQLKEFFKSIDYEVETHNQGFRGKCPACHAAFCFIGLNGRHHLLYWKCFDRRCDSNIPSPKESRRELWDHGIGSCGRGMRN